MVSIARLDAGALPVGIVSGNERGRMSDSTIVDLVDEMVETLGGSEPLGDWIARRCDGSVGTTTMNHAMADITGQLLSGRSPQVTLWERLFMAVAMQSTEKQGQTSFEACTTALDRLAELLEDDGFATADDSDVITLGTALTLLLAAQRKLHQRIEYCVGLLCNKHPKCLDEMAERCEELWHRCGQMSGASSLFVWDQRRDEWRLAQDFKPYRPKAPDA